MHVSDSQGFLKTGKDSIVTSIKQKFFEILCEKLLFAVLFIPFTKMQEN